MTDNSNYPSGFHEPYFDCEPDETEEEENERLSNEQDYNDPEK